VAASVIHYPSLNLICCLLAAGWEQTWCSHAPQYHASQLKFQCCRRRGSYQDRAGPSGPSKLAVKSRLLRSISTESRNSQSCYLLLVRYLDYQRELRMPPESLLTESFLPAGPHRSLLLTIVSAKVSYLRCSCKISRVTVNTYNVFSLKSCLNLILFSGQSPR